MENLEIKGESGVYFIPEVNLNASNGQCQISGESYLEDTDEFYNNIINWLEAYINEVKKPLTFDFRLTYFNTSSSRSILNVLRVLKKYEDRGGSVTVNWYYPEDDESIAEEAEDYMKDTGLKINMSAFEPED
jgi:SiaC family regulatory phosphoprotein